MVKRIAYQKGMERFARNLEEFGFELYPYAIGIPFDAVLYDGNKQTKLLKNMETNKEIFILNIHALSPGNAAKKLKSRLYSPLFKE